MLSRLTARRAALGRRRCCACGYAGRDAQRALDGRRAQRDAVDADGGPFCPQCGCDFAARPPRSYAEMEGLDIAGRSPSRHADVETIESRMVERWVGFLFLLILVLAGMVSMVTQLFAPGGPQP